ncbi:MAG: hypothetical protein V1870_04215 [Candidatus Aenigmatarchaeota archaeon]
MDYENPNNDNAAYHTSFGITTTLISPPIGLCLYTNISQQHDVSKMKKYTRHNWLGTKTVVFIREGR